MRRLLRRFGFQISLLLLVGLIGAGGIFVLAVVLPDMQAGAATPSSTPGASPTAPAAVMAWVNLPANADCAACHQTEGGVGTLTVPRIAHPLRGWTECTACHANDRLVATAPGHSGIHATDCLVCHEPADLPAPLSRPHRELENQDCLSCHGKTEPLPEDMAHRAQSVCWLCHRLPEEQPPIPQHAIVAGQADCFTCHVAADVGALPADHASRTVNECLLCHVPGPGATFTPGPFSTPPPGAPQGLRWPLVFVRRT
ncbi:MAG: hypothetical protein ABI452_01830 [Candidatus Limnocylindrales bacterium]